MKTTLAAVLAPVLLASAALAAETAPADPKKADRKDPRTYTQADIDRILRESPPPTPLPDAGPTEVPTVPPEQRAAPRKTKAGEEPAAFTNEDLERMFGVPEAPAEAAAASPDASEQAMGSEALKEQAHQAAQAGDAQRRAAAAKARVAELESRLNLLEARILAFRNPYLPRPTLTEEEAARYGGLRADQQVKLAEEDAAKVRAELEKARADLPTP